MFCSKCGQPLQEGARFCSKCGCEVSPSPSSSGQTANFNSAPRQNRRMLRCPKCDSEDIQFTSSTTSKGVSVRNSCCGYILLGPLGLLCGLHKAGESTTSEFWVCRNCGARFGDYEANSSSLTDQSLDVWSELRDVTTEYEEQTNQLKAEYPKYKKADKLSMIGAGIIVLALFIVFTGLIPVAIVVALIGLVICFIGMGREEKIFNEIASPELKSLRKRKEFLEARKKEIEEKKKELKEKSGLR